MHDQLTLVTCIIVSDCRLDDISSCAYFTSKTKSKSQLSLRKYERNKEKSQCRT